MVEARRSERCRRRPRVVQKDFVGNDGHFAPGADRREFRGLARLYEGAGGIIGMHDEHARGARRERGAQACEIDLPAVIVEQRIGHQANVGEVGEKFEQRIARRRHQDFVARLRRAGGKRRCRLRWCWRSERCAPGRGAPSRPAKPWPPAIIVADGCARLRQAPAFGAVFEGAADRPAPQGFLLPGRRSRRSWDSRRSDRAGFGRCGGELRAPGRSGLVRGASLCAKRTCGVNAALRSGWLARAMRSSDSTLPSRT